MSSAFDSFTLSVLIFLLVIGPAVGNYACSVVYRLPRGKTPFERHPFCGHCNADLKPIDLFPILSWLSTRGKCRYCGGAIPGVYTVIELACGALFIANFLHFGMSEAFLLFSAAGVFVVILAAIQWQHGWISASIYSYAFLSVMLARALAEHTIYGTIHGSFLMLVLALAVERAMRRQSFAPFTRPWIWWMVLLGALTPMAQWTWLLPVAALATVLPRSAQAAWFAAVALIAPLVQSILP